VLLEQLDNAQLNHLLNALCPPTPIDRETQLLRKQVARALPRKVRKHLETLSPPNPSVEMWARYRSAVADRTARAALLLCRSPRVALSELLRAEGLTPEQLEQEPTLVQLLQFVTSDEYVSANRQLWSAGPRAD